MLYPSRLPDIFSYPDPMMISFRMYPYHETGQMLDEENPVAALKWQDSLMYGCGSLIVYGIPKYENSSQFTQNV